MTFKKGEPRPKGAGRRPGSPNLVTRDLRQMVLGALDGAGGMQYLQQQASENPQAFLGLVGRCLPKDVKLTSNLEGDVIIRFSNGKVQA